MRRWAIVLFIALMGACCACAQGKRALVVGISSYPALSADHQGWPAIHGTNDAALLQGALRRQGFDITMLLDEEATAANIRAALQKLAAATQPGDLVFIHFSGHGQPYEDLSGDEDDGWDEAFVAYDALPRYEKGAYEGLCHILDDELKRHLTAIRRKAGSRGYVFVTLDACHMGGASRGDETQDEGQHVRGTDKGFSPNGKKYIPRIDRRGNMAVEARPQLAHICILEACRSYQTNTEIRQGGKYYGPLTYYTCQTLQRIELSSDAAWAETVRSLMDRDPRLIKQNMVIETSE